MQGFNPELKVGMPAMVIATRDPKNSHCIGKIVLIDALYVVGELLSDQWLSDSWLESGKKVDPFDKDVAVVTGCHVNISMKEPHAIFNRKHLMPLPPLDDDAIIFANENVKETEKC